MDLSLTDEQESFRQSIIKFARKELNENIIKNETEGYFSFEKWRKCAEFGLLSLLCPKEYGGHGSDLLSTLISIQALSYACKDSGLVHAIVTQLCCLLQISLFGSELQKREYLYDIASGNKIAAQAITEPDAGSDIHAIRTKAELFPDKYILNGSKIFITNGPIADVVIVFAVTDSQKKKFGGISSFLVDKEIKGFSRGEPLEKMGLRTLKNGELFFDDCHIPKESILGKEGQGIFIFNEVIEWERALLSAAHIGTMERIFEKCNVYVETRNQFGQPIKNFQSVSNKIASMKVNIELAKLILYKVACLKDKKKKATLEASIAKLFVSESLKKACLDAVQLHGAYGYMKEFEIERELRDSIASTIYSGTSELQSNLIASLANIKL